MPRQLSVPAAEHFRPRVVRARAVGAQVAGATVAALLLLTTSCTVGSPGTAQPPEPPASAAAVTASPAAHADPDRHFVDQQLPLHDQAVEMSTMVLAKDSGVEPDVRALARQVVKASQAEITTMNGWLSAWGPAPEEHQAEDHTTEEEDPNHHDTPGLMTDGQMELLQYTDGPIKQQVYLEGMVKNRRATVALAELQAREGRRADARTFAESLHARHVTELATLEELQQR